MDRRPRSRSRERDARRHGRSSSRERDLSRVPGGLPVKRKFVRKGPTGWDVMPSGATPGLSAASHSADAAASSAVVPGAPSQQTRHARRLYVGGLGESTEREIGEFFSDLVRNAAVTPPKANPVLSVYINAERKFAFVEFSSIELANAIMQLDGLLFKGQPLKVRRPNDYDPTTLPAEMREAVEPLNTANIPLAAGSSSSAMGGGGGSGGFGGGGAGGGGFGGMGGGGGGIGGGAGSRDSLHRIFLGGLPAALGEAQLAELLGAFGRLRTLNIVRGPDGAHKGYGFAEFEDPSVTDMAIGALNGLTIGERPITVSRAKAANSSTGGGGGGAGGAPAGRAMGGGGAGGGGWSGSNNIPLGAAGGGGGLDGGYGANGGAAAGYSGSIEAAAAAAAAALHGGAAQQQQQHPAYAVSGAPIGIPSSCVCLEQMVTPAELTNNAEYTEILEDVTAECSKYGALINVQVPRPPHDAAGRVFLQYSDMGGAISAATALAGRVFGGRRIIARYYPDSAFATGRFSE